MSESVSVWGIDDYNKAKEKAVNEYSSIIFGVDGDQKTAYFDDFINLQESPCGFGNTQKDAVEHLLEQWT